MHSCSHCNASFDSGFGTCPRCGAEASEPVAEPPSARSRTSIGPWHELRSKRPAAVHVLPRPLSAARHAQRSARFEGAAAVAFARSDGERRASDAHPRPKLRAEVVPLHPRTAQDPLPPESESARPGPSSARARDVAITETGRHPAVKLPSAEGVISETGRHATVARGDATARVTPSGQVAAKPLVLASECLRRELAPATPAQRGVQLLAVAVGLIGMVGTWLVSGPRGLGLPVGGALLALSVLGVVPMPYAARAMSLATVAGSVLAVVTWHRTERAQNLDPLILGLGVVVLAMALLFRSWHRASAHARVLVGVGLALCAGWLWSSHGLQRLLVLESNVQAWLLPVLAVPFALLLLLSLLGFMDSGTTGGCALWAALLLVWYGVHDWADLAVRYWPVDAVGPALARVPAEVAVTGFSAPLFAAVLAAALSQLLAVSSADDSE